MNIVVSFKAKYGKDLFYPESDDAVFLAKFSGRPTLLKHQLKMALDRGWEVIVVQEQFNLVEYLNDKPSNSGKENVR
jgi:hypothetical protein